MFGVRGRFRGRVKRRKPLRVTFFICAVWNHVGIFFPVWGHWLTPFLREHFCICARCLSLHKCRIHAHKQIEPAQMQGWRAQTAILCPIWYYQHTIIYAPIVGRILKTRGPCCRILNDLWWRINVWACLLITACCIWDETQQTWREVHSVCQRGWAILLIVYVWKDKCSTIVSYISSTLAQSWPFFIYPLLAS